MTIASALRSSSFAFAAILLICAWGRSLAAEQTTGCVVIASRIGVAVDYQLVADAGPGKPVSLAPGAVRSHHISGTTSIRFGAGAQAQQHALESDRAYVFVPQPDQETPDLRLIDFGDKRFDAIPPSARLRPTDQQLAAGVLTIRIVIDGREPETIAYAERRLRRRVATASELLAAAMGVRLEVQSLGVWDPSTSAEDWESARRDLAARAPSESARLVLGFTRQYPASATDIAKSRGSEEPLATHLLLPDTHAGFSEEQCLETMLHELGHFWGAPHVSETSSPMRTSLDERAGPWPLAFDPASALAMSLVADEVRQRGIRDWNEISSLRRQRLETLRTRVASARAPAAVAAPDAPPAPARRATPRVREVTVPSIPGGDAIWTGVTRDRAGKLWFAISTSPTSNESPQVFEYDGVRPPQSRGDLATALAKVAAAVAGERSSILATPIQEGEDGHLYFASLGDSLAMPDLRRNPRWGSRLWRIRRPDNTWEMLLHIPENIASLACQGEYVYLLTAPEQRLIQWHVASAKSRSVTLELPTTPACRTLVFDSRGHLFLPLRSAGNNQRGPGAAVDLVEFDAQLQSIHRTPLEHYPSPDNSPSLVEDPATTSSSPPAETPPSPAASGISSEPGILAAHRDAKSTRFLTSNGALYSIQARPPPAPKAASVPPSSAPYASPRVPNAARAPGPPRNAPRPGLPSANNVVPRPRTAGVGTPQASPSPGTRVAPLAAPRNAVVELIDVMPENPRLLAGTFHEDGEELALTAIVSGSSSRHSLALVPVNELQPGWSELPSHAQLAGLTLTGPVAVTEGGRYWFAGTYARGPLSLSESLLQALSEQGFTREQLDALRLNAKQERQPVLFSVEFETDVEP